MPFSLPTPGHHLQMGTTRTGILSDPPHPLLLQPLSRFVPKIRVRCESVVICEKGGTRDVSWGASRKWNDHPPCPVEVCFSSLPKFGAAGGVGPQHAGRQEVHPGVLGPGLSGAWGPHSWTMVLGSFPGFGPQATGPLTQENYVFWLWICCLFGSQLRKWGEDDNLNFSHSCYRDLRLSLLTRRKEPWVWGPLWNQTPSSSWCTPSETGPSEVCPVSLLPAPTLQRNFGRGWVEGMFFVGNSSFCLLLVISSE